MLGLRDLMAGDIFNLFNLDTIFVPPHLTCLTYILYIEQTFRIA